MASTMIKMLLLYSLCAFIHTSSAAKGQGGGEPVGVAYGTFANNQPSAQDAVNVVRSVGIRRMRLYGPDRSALQALRNTGIEVMLGVSNDQLQWVASNQRNADQWVQGNVKDFSNVNFRFIVVGNGVTPVHNTNAYFAQFVLPAMQNIRNALNRAGMQWLRVTTAVDQSEILGRSFPPSQAEFRGDVRGFIDPIVQFLVNNNNAPLLVNLHPYYSYLHNKQDIPPHLQGKENRLQYVLFQEGNFGNVQDGRVTYTNVFDAMVDSMHAALEKIGGNSLDVVVSETGWPTAGGPAANNQNAAAHNNNLIRHVRSTGTPKRPTKRIEAYIFSLFDENLRPQEVEKHLGVFWNNKQAKYQINFNQ